MADRSYPSARIKNFQHDCVLIAGHFSVTPGAPGAITAGGRFGSGYTVAVTATGRYTITTDDPYRHVVACGCQYCAVTPTDYYMAPDVPAGGAGAAVTWEIDLWDNTAGAVTTTAAAGDEIHFWMILSNNQNDRAAW
jgi:hypothetical protein